SYNPALQQLVKAGRSPRATEATRTELEGLASFLPRLPREDAELSTVALERFIGTNDLLPVAYLEQGVMTAQSIGRVVAESRFGELEAIGTGFLIAPGLMMTNNHVLSSAEDAATMFIEFNYQRGPDGQYRQSHRFRLEANRLFITSEADKLDFTLVAVAPQSVDGSQDLAAFGSVRLAAKGTPRKDSFVSIIQHPDGAEKQVSIRENRVLAIGVEGGLNREDALWYASDTAPGSSGSPVFDDAWRVVALHHAGVPERRSRNNKVEIQLVDGRWVPDEDLGNYKDTMIRWTANEGVLIQSILEELRRKAPEPVPALISSLFTGLSAPPRRPAAPGGALPALG
ncbi:MAG TPA: serine protease, partial [Myxococcota bacterium]|nr:serine protease [Myxococcota bacterium]